MFLLVRVPSCPEPGFILDAEDKCQLLVIWDVPRTTITTGAFEMNLELCFVSGCWLMTDQAIWGAPVLFDCWGKGLLLWPRCSLKLMIQNHKLLKLERTGYQPSPLI